MASTYSPLLRLEMIASGEQTGLWGNTTNGNLGSLLEQAISGVTFITMSSTSYTLSAYNGAVDEARAAVIVLSGNPGAASSLIVPLSQKVYWVKNGTQQTVTVKTSSQVGGVAITAGNSLPVFCDGTNVYAGITPDALGAPALNGSNATGTWNISITGNAGTVTNGVYTTMLTTGSNATGKIPKYSDSYGIFGIGYDPYGQWKDGASDGTYYAYGFEWGLGSMSTSTLANSAGSLWREQARIALMFNGYVALDGIVRNKVNGNGFGARVCAFEIWNNKFRMAFSDEQTTGGQQCDLVAKFELDPDGDVVINGALTQLSDARLKDNVEPVRNALAKVMALKPVTFTRKDHEDKQRRHVGFIAQEVQKVVPEVVDDPNGDGYLAVAYQNLVPMLVSALQAHERTIKKLEDRLRALESGVAGPDDVI